MFDDSSAEPRSDRRIRWWHGILLFGVALLFQLTIVFVAGLAGAAGLLGSTREEVARALSSPTAVVVQVLLTCSALTAVSLLVPRAFRVRASRWLGLVSAPPRLIAAAAVGMVGAGFLVDELVYLVHSAAPALFDSYGLDAFNRIFYSASPVAFAALTAAVVIGPGIGEELFFRGFALRSFLSGLPAWLAVLASAALFGALHMNLLQGFGAFTIGIYLGFVVWKTGSLWVGIASHGINNLLCALFARFDAGGAGHIWNTGHSAPVLLVSAAVTAGAVGFIVRKTGQKK